MLKRIVFGLAVATVAIVATIAALNIYRHLTADENAPPGIIFERTDRPARV